MQKKCRHLCKSAKWPNMHKTLTTLSKFTLVAEQAQETWSKAGLEEEAGVQEQMSRLHKAPSEGGPTCKIILRRVMMNGLWPSLRMKNLLNGQKTKSVHPLHLRISSVPISIRCNEEQVVQKNISRCSCACDKQRDFLTVFSTAWECCAVL